MNFVFFSLTKEFQLDIIMSCLGGDSHKKDKVICMTISVGCFSLLWRWFWGEGLASASKAWLSPLPCQEYPPSIGIYWDPPRDGELYPSPSEPQPCWWNCSKAASNCKIRNIRHQLEFIEIHPAMILPWKLYISPPPHILDEPFWQDFGGFVQQLQITVTLGISSFTHVRAYPRP